MTSRDIVLKLKQRINKKDTNDLDNISVFQLVEAYNKAELSGINRIMSPKDPLRAGIEATIGRIDDLKNLIPEQPKKILVDKKDKYYITKDFPADYFHYIDSYSVGYTTLCKAKEIRHIQKEESNIRLLLRNETINPSFLWAETPITLVKNKLKVWTNNEFDVKAVYLTYLIKPTPIDVEGYYKEDGSASTNVDSVLPDHLQEIFIDDAAVILQGDIGNQQGMQKSMVDASKGE